MKNLEKLGIRTVINLRCFNNDQERRGHVCCAPSACKILTWDIDDKHVVEVMRMLQGPRTALSHPLPARRRPHRLMSAMYRILEQGWTVRCARGAHRAATATTRCGRTSCATCARPTSELRAAIARRAHRFHSTSPTIVIGAAEDHAA
jgi:hypothetical protein